MRLVVHMAAVFFLICVQVAFGADIKITSTASPSQLSLNDRLKVTVSITGADANKVSAPVLKENPEFTVVGRPSQTTEFSYINGVVSHFVSYIYILIPNKTGTFVVGGAAVSDGKNMYSAPGTRVEVTSADRQAGANSRGKETPAEPDVNENIFIRTSVDKKDPYVGEQVTLTFELYNRSTIWGDTEYEPPSTTGFWTVELQKIPATTTLYNNRPYHYNTIKTALFPTTSGELTIGPASLDYTTGGFFSINRAQKLYTKPIILKVIPLPSEGKPPDFSGAVGSFEIAASADKTTIKANDVVSITVAVSGRGNLDLVSSLKTPDLSAFKTYDPKVSNAILNSGFVVGGGKTWEYILMPKFQGAVTIEPFSLSFFDPKDKSYHTVSTQPIKLKVTPGEVASTVETGTVGGRNAIQKIADDINYIKPDKSSLVSADRRMYASIFFYLMYIVPLTIFTAAFAVKKRRDMIEGNTGLKRKIKAWKKTQKRLEEASRLKNKGEQAVFYGRLSEAITEYIGDRLNVDTGPMTTAALCDTLVENGVGSELADKIGKTLELCDFFRFSSTGSGQDTQAKLLQNAHSIVNNLRQLL